MIRYREEMVLNSASYKPLLMCSPLFDLKKNVPYHINVVIIKI